MYKSSIADAMNYNRDENSFTSRLFQGVLIPEWQQDNTKFLDFLNFLQKVSGSNASKLKIEGWNSDHTINITQFISCTLFFELWDLFHYCKSKGHGFPDGYKPDKTELDAVIVCSDSSGKNHLLVFEVKCYSDLTIEELKRQQKHIDEYSRVLDFEYHHFVLISIDNLKNAKTIFLPEKSTINKSKLHHPLYVITWDDIDKKGYLKGTLFDRRSLKLYKTISSDGRGKQPRALIDLKNSSI